MSQNPKLVQHKRGPSSVLLKLLDHVSLLSINTPGTTTSFSFKCSNPEFAGFGLCQWFAFTSDPSSPTNSNQCDVPSSESSRKWWVFCTTCFCTSRRTRPKCNNTSKIHSPPAWKTVKISRMPSMWSMRSTMGSTMGSVISTYLNDISMDYMWSHHARISTSLPVQQHLHLQPFPSWL